MKILLVSSYHPELVRGGAQQVAYDLFKSLQEMPGMEPVLLCSSHYDVPPVFSQGARIVAFDGRGDEYLFLSHGYDYVQHRLPDPVQAQAFAAFLLSIKPDVVHFHHFMTYGVDYLTLTRRILPKARIIFTAHDFLSLCANKGLMQRTKEDAPCALPSPVRCYQCFPQRRPEDFFLRQRWMQTHLAAADKITVPSRFMLPFFAAWGIEADRLVHVPNGIACAPAPVLPVRAHPDRFGFFGQLVDAKGVRLLFEAVALLRAEGFVGFEVEVNGDNLHFSSPETRAFIEAFLAAEAQRPLAAQLVRFNGGYHHSQLASRMGQIDWVVAPSLWREAFGLVVSEAWYFGRPVIVPHQGGPAERVKDDENGLLFEMGNVRSLAQTMRRAASEPGLWDRLVAGIEPPTSCAKMCAGYAAVYKPSDKPVRKKQSV